MRAGLLKHWIEIQENTGSVNSSGQIDENWTTVSQRKGFVRPLSGRELRKGEAQQGETTHEVLTRYFPSVLPHMRVIYNGRVLEIESVINTRENNTQLVLLCKEKIGEIE